MNRIVLVIDMNEEALIPKICNFGITYLEPNEKSSVIFPLPFLISKMFLNDVLSCYHLNVII